ncbi:C39 family peptidase [Bacillus sp. NEB1478]|uniref:C39 family peptidase n=1 Tax=Bacillus sp. NEB1478 TaxID=3073816 RepID=UPI0028738B6A|nr:C39 family peptidase [Bacillus sp. NEB1478]WNB92667.1 C39 family peptidase [Bacillus sp. NEB1478]
MKKLLFILVLAFMVGAFYGYYQDKKTEAQEEGKMDTLLSNKNTNQDKANVTKENGVTLIKNVPLIMQMPELDRGCEVTSLAMLLQYAKVDVDKMELAKKIKKLDTPYEHKNGVYYYGNPNDGFVGDIYTFDKMGYGVYHKPIASLGEKYLPDRIKDISGQSFKDVLRNIEKGKPVWIITNATFKKLPENEFRTWNTPSGKVQITWKEHSVVITGFDEENVYINDPLVNKPNRKLPKDAFQKAWEQMGSQAITIH